MRNKKNWAPYNRQDLSVHKTLVRCVPVGNPDTPRIQSPAEGLLEQLAGNLAESVELLRASVLQLEYLQEKFGPTGTTTQLLTKLKTALQQYDS